MLAVIDWLGRVNAVNFLGSWINIGLIKDCNSQNWFGFNFTFNKLGNSFDIAQYSGWAWITHAVGE